MLTDAQIERYSRQIILPELGGRGQAKLLSASVTLVGDGHLAAAAALYLVAAGIGRVAVGGAHVDLVADLNPDCRVVPLSDGLLEQALADSSVVVCADVRSELRSRIHCAGGVARRQLLWGFAQGGVGAVSICASDRDGVECRACGLEQAERATCAGRADDPLATITAGLIGTLLATNVLKSVIGMETYSPGRVLVFEAREGTFSETPLDC